jgi:TolA-binding protein
MKYALAALLLSALAVLPGAPARAQFDSREAIALNNQIAELRRDVQVLREQLARGGGSSSDTPSSLGGYRPAPASGGAGGSELAAQLLERVSQLEDEVRRLRGRIDETDNARQRQGEDLGKQIGDLNFKLDGMAGGPKAPPAALPVPLPSAPPAPSAPAAPTRRTPELALQEGNAALARHDYATAEADAREVLATPRSPRSIDASFLLAQALAGRKDWAKAAVAYDDTYGRAKTGGHAPDSLVGLAVSLTNLGEKKAACQTLDKLRIEFPAPRPDLREQVAGARVRAGCR